LLTHRDTTMSIQGTGVPHREAVEAEERQAVVDYRTLLQNVIAKYSTKASSDFACEGQIDATIGVPAVHVKGVGRIGYPLPKEQAVPLKNADYSELKHPACCCWRIDSSLVQINQDWLRMSLPKLLVKCCTKLGVDAGKISVQARLCEMQLHEEGGYFKKHGTEKEPGMFGLLLIQLPAEHEGGQLTVEHDGQTKRFPFDKDSADQACYTAFYSDCAHIAEPVTKGLRLLLVFHLVCDDQSSAGHLPSAADLNNPDKELTSATKAWCEDKTAVPKLALPLIHDYYEYALSFASLEGTDLSAAKLVQNATNPSTGEKLFRVYLAQVTRINAEVGNPFAREFSHFEAYMRGDDDDYYSDTEIETTYKTERWIGPHGSVPLLPLEVEIPTEILPRPGVSINDEVDNIFGTEDYMDEDDDDYDDPYDVCSPKHRSSAAVLVFWPAEKDFDILLPVKTGMVVEILQKADRASPDYHARLDRLLTQLGSSSAYCWSAVQILSLVQTVEQVRRVLRMVQHVGKDEASAAAIVTEVCKHGWSELGESFTALVKAQTAAGMSVLLTLLAPHCQMPTSAAFTSDACASGSSSSAVPHDAWQELVQVMVNKALQPDTTPPIMAARSNRFLQAVHESAVSSHASFGLPPPPTFVAPCDRDAVLVSRFVLAHCDVRQQEAVSAHLGRTLSLHSLNHLLAELHHPAGGVPDHPFQARLRACAVQMCLEKKHPDADVAGVVDWVVSGGYIELFEALRPVLQGLWHEPSLSKMVFSLPSVVHELQTVSALSAELEGLVQARIAALQPHVPTAPHSWRLPADLLTTSDPRVGPFLASDRQSASLTGGFGGIPGARKWVKQHFGAAGVSQRGVSAVPFGTGKGAGVILTKHRADEGVQRCAEEVRALQKLLRVHDRDTGDGSKVSGGDVRSGSEGGVSSDSGAAGIDGGWVVVGVAGGDESAQKKAKVETHMYVPA